MATRVIGETESERRRRQAEENAREIQQASARRQEESAARQAAKRTESGQRQAYVEKVTPYLETAAQKAEQKGQTSTAAAIRQEIRGLKDYANPPGYTVTVVGGTQRQIAEAQTGQIRIRSATGQYQDIVVTPEGTMSASAAAPMLAQIERQRTRASEVETGIRIGQRAAAITGNVFTEQSARELGLKPSEYTVTYSPTQPGTAAPSKSRPEAIRAAFGYLESPVTRELPPNYQADIKARQTAAARTAFGFIKSPVEAGMPPPVFTGTPEQRKATAKQQAQIQRAGELFESYRVHEQRVQSIGQYWEEQGNIVSQPWAWGGTAAPLRARSGVGQFFAIGTGQLLGSWQLIPSGALLIGQKALTLAAVSPSMTKESLKAGITTTPQERQAWQQQMNPLTPRGAVTWANVGLSAYMVTAALYSKPVTPQPPKTAPSVSYRYSESFKFTRQAPGDIAPIRAIGEQRAYATYTHVTETIRPQEPVFAFWQAGKPGQSTVILQNLQTGGAIVQATAGAKTSVFHWTPGVVGGMRGILTTKTATFGRLGIVQSGVSTRYITMRAPKLTIGKTESIQGPESRVFGKVKASDIDKAVGKQDVSTLYQVREKYAGRAVKIEQPIDILRKVEYKGYAGGKLTAEQRTQLQNPTVGSVTWQEVLKKGGTYEQFRPQTFDIKELQGTIKIGRTTWPTGKYSPVEYGPSEYNMLPSGQLGLMRTGYTYGFEPGRATTFRTLTTVPKGGGTYAVSSRLPEYLASGKASLMQFLRSEKGSVAITPLSRQVVVTEAELTTGISALPAIAGGVSTVLPPIQAIFAAPGVTRFVPTIGTVLVGQAITRTSGMQVTPQVQRQIAYSQVSTMQRTPTIMSALSQKVTTATKTQITPSFMQTQQTAEQIARTTSKSFSSQAVVPMSQIITPVAPSAPGPIFPTAPMPFILPPLAALPKFGDVSGGFTGQKPSKRKRRLVPKYSPSLRAITMKIKAPRGFKPEQFTGTGFEIRPIAQNQKPRKRKK